MLEDDRVVGLFYLTVYRPLAAQIKVPCQLLGYGTCASDTPTGNYTVLYSSYDTDDIESLVLVEGLILDSDESVLHIVRDLIVFCQSPGIRRADSLQLVSLVIVQHGRSVQQAVDIFRIDSRSRQDNVADIGSSRKDDREYDYQHHFQHAVLFLFLFLLFLPILGRLIMSFRHRPVIREKLIVY